ncbi:MAG TPA: OmpA family protein [Terriglobales bacterium]|nr:OmpA family protein [Terriglobales bacterium]
MMSRIVAVLAFAVFGLPVAAQSGNPAPDPQSGTGTAQQSIQVEPMDETPVYRVSVVSRTAKAVNYRDRTGETKIGFKGTDLMSNAKGEAKIDPKPGRLAIEASLENMKPATTFGPEYLTYVLWAITPEGRPRNLGELLVNDDGKAHTDVTTNLQAFGLIVTAEPYFAVSQPSNLVVAENVIPTNVKGWERPIDAKFDLIQRGEYTADIPVSQLPSIKATSETPQSLVQAENAVAIAKATGAEKYAPEALRKAEEFLDKGRDYLRRDQNEKAIGTVARGATQQAEDARLLTIRRKQEERLAAERRQQQERTAAAQAQAQQEVAARQQAEQERLAAEQARTEAERARLEAEAAAQRAAQERQQAEAARQAALEQQQQLQTEAQRSQLAAEQAQQTAQEAQRQREEMRARLQQQLNTVLETKQTARGLIVNMSDVLFDTGKATLKPGAKLRLAKVAGIIMAYPDLRLEIEGHTDSTGTPEFNQVLSERRAATVRDYLISQGVPVNNVVARGFGQTSPVAANTTAQGRQLNRRVDLVVSGEAIGVNTGPGGPAGSPGMNAGGGTSAGQPGTGTSAGAATSGGVTGTATGTQGSPQQGVGASGTVATPAGTGAVGAGTQNPPANTTPPPM